MKKKTEKAERSRNPIACHPLLRKGGAHVKTHKSKRKSAKQALIREWPVVNPPAAASQEFTVRMTRA